MTISVYWSSLSLTHWIGLDEFIFQNQHQFIVFIFVIFHPPKIRYFSHPEVTKYSIPQKKSCFFHRNSVTRAIHTSSFLGNISSTNSNCSSAACHSTGPRRRRRALQESQVDSNLDSTNSTNSTNLGDPKKKYRRMFIYIPYRFPRSIVVIYIYVSYMYHTCIYISNSTYWRYKTGGYKMIYWYNPQALVDFPLGKATRKTGTWWLVSCERIEQMETGTYLFEPRNLRIQTMYPVTLW